MNTVTRKKSPRAPSISLGDAIEKVSRIYDMDRCHAAPIDGVAKHIGYKSAANGSALSTIASLKYYGLIERPRDGMLSVSKEFESYRFAPTEAIKQELLTKWLKSPAIFAELLDKYVEGLPSDATLKFELIQKGFAPAAADVCLGVFLRSVDYAHYFERAQSIEQQATDVSNDEMVEQGAQEFPPPVKITPATTAVVPTAISPPPVAPALADDVDRIPVRLVGGRRAWIEIPMPFYEADKDRLKKQIDLLLTEDEGHDEDLL